VQHGRRHEAVRSIAMKAAGSPGSHGRPRRDCARSSKHTPGPSTNKRADIHLLSLLSVTRRATTGFVAVGGYRARTRSFRRRAALRPSSRAAEQARALREQIRIGGQIKSPQVPTPTSRPIPVPTPNDHTKHGVHRCAARRLTGEHSIRSRREAELRAAALIAKSQLNGGTRGVTRMSAKAGRKAP
jgi:hypothetical protein